MKNPSQISKYAGLQLIERYGLPHPDWLFVSSPQQVRRRAWACAPHGWTVRCTPTLMYSFALPASHCLPFPSIGSVIQRLSKNHKIDMFVIYPSWKFDISGGLLLDGPSSRLEVVKGDIAMLLRGKRSPDASFSHTAPALSGWLCVQGKESVLGAEDRAVLLRATKVLAAEDHLLFEWTKTTEGRLVFHDCLKYS